MPAKPKTALKLETEWLREYARAYLPSEAAFSFSADALRRAGVTLVGIRNACREGIVFFSDKLDDPGAVWMVEGDDGDGNMLVITLVVITDTMSVSLYEVEKVSGVEGEEGGYDAA